MLMEYLNKGEIKISMEVYLREVLEYFTEEITGRAETPEAAQLFEVQSGEEKLIIYEQKARELHYYVAQLLFTLKR